MAGRMSPAKQDSARAALKANMANVHTGDAEVDSMLAKEVARRATFAVPQPVAVSKNPLSGIGAAIGRLFPKKKVR